MWRPSVHISSRVSQVIRRHGSASIPADDAAEANARDALCDQLSQRKNGAPGAVKSAMGTAVQPIRIVPLRSEGLAPVAKPRLSYRGGPLPSSAEVFLILWRDAW